MPISEPRTSHNSARLKDTYRLLRAVFRYSLSLSSLVLLWIIATDVFFVPPGLLPSLSKVITSIWIDWSEFYFDFAISTFYKASIGGIIGITIGFIFALTLGYSNFCRWLFEPYLTIFQSFPREALYPILVIALGVGNSPQIMNAALLSFFPTAIATLHGISDTRRDYIDLAQSWGASRLQEFTSVRLPYAVPALMGALRLALPFALIGAVLAEMLGGSTQRGLGNLIVSAQAGQDSTATYAAILILAAFGMALVALLQAFEYFVLKRFRHE